MKYMKIIYELYINKEERRMLYNRNENAIKIAYQHQRISIGGGGENQLKMAA